jgi:formylglycine-generating enzyme required for sulfatase activity
VTIDWVTVGQAGNPADPLTGGLYGAVTHEYQIGKYELTNAQYAVFLNAVDPTGANPNGIYNANMGSNARGGIAYAAGATNGTKYTVRSNMGDKPVNYVSWFDAARFSNWLHNGQGNGSTETGAYTLNGVMSGIVYKNADAKFWIPTEDEWYKAAYYDPTMGGTGGYWLYPTQSNTVPTVGTASATGDISNPGANVANYNWAADWNGQNGNLTTVGSAGADNYFGTADQGGNVWEWNDAVISGWLRGRRGGSWNDSAYGLPSLDRTHSDPTSEFGSVGFRVASVPEPSAMVLTILFSAALCTCRKR